MTAQAATTELPRPRRCRLPGPSQQRGLGEHPAQIKFRYVAKG